MKINILLFKKRTNACSFKTRKPTLKGYEIAKNIGGINYYSLKTI